MLSKAGWLKVAVFLACLIPLAQLAWKGFDGRLGANPIEVVTHSTGIWTLIFLLITLSITPLRKMFGQPWLINFRRMIGLFAFFYGSLHLLTYVWLDKFFDWTDITKDVYKRPFITAGFTAFVLMVPLAATSTKRWIQRLGGRRWNLLHKLVYVSALAGVVHFYWLVKKDITEPLIYGSVLAALLSYRVGVWAWKKSESGKRVPRSAGEDTAANGSSVQVTADAD
ncbi:MAG TPA: protein-methionine-sulfoxide reductase heme-binding subunit MsrQ [Terriglobales bacterium]|nr:protein-methionine-sulfoxide reductase heme-binding subunit MsrQ [Terriglobales bacterium]